MECEILDALQDLRYEKDLDENGLNQVLANSQQYSKLLEWVCSELKSCSKLEESVTQIENDEDLSTFYMELSSLLKELGCPYSQLMEGSSNERFEKEYNRKLALNFLLAELQAARISYINNPTQLKVQISESPTAKLLREMLRTLGIPKPPEGIPIPALMSKVNDRLKQIREKMPAELKGEPLFIGELSPKQWSQLEALNDQFQAEYKLRREMLLKRLDVTIQSFHWSDRLKSKTDHINKAYREKRQLLTAAPSVAVSHILAARKDLTIIEKTSNASVRRNTHSSVNTVVIGKVPDRGGRPNEAQPPPPEMPSWQQRQGGPPGGGGGYGRGGGGNAGRGGSGTQGWTNAPKTQRDYGEGRGPRGGQQSRVQGGWSSHGQQQKDHNGGGYQDPQQNYGDHQRRGGGGNYQQQGSYNQHDNRGNHYYSDNSTGYQQGGYQNQERDHGDQGYQSRGGGRGGNQYRGGGGGYRGGNRGGRHQY